MTQPTQRGFVSLMTAILLSLLLLAITVSLIGLQTLTLRKAEDSEQSQRAYYAAESGIEDGIARIDTGVVSPGNDQSCAQNLNLTTGTSVLGWSCQTITFSGSPANDIKLPDISQNIDPAGASFNSVRLLWNQTTLHQDTDAAYYTPPATGASGITAGWGDKAMPLELTVVKYPTGNFNASSIVTQTIFVVPAQQGAVSDPVGNPGTSAASVVYSDKIPYQVNASDVGNNGCTRGNTINCGIDSNTPYKAFCGQEIKDPSGTGSYHCEVVVSNLPSGFNYLFRLRSRYVADDGAGSGQYVMDFYSGSTLVPVQDSTATIDVTGQAGDVFRRVIYKLPVGNLASGDINDALFSEVGVCQNYQVLENVGTGATSQTSSCP